jgi:radical SAM-linked protein
MARPTPGGPPPAPTVQRLTIRYAKRGRMRFASHRDVARAIERGVRRAGLPVAYSAGFSPHPRISYSGGAPTGSASEAEYLELALTRRLEPDDVRRQLDAALPDGIDVIEVAAADGRSAGAQIEASEWEVVWPGVPADAAAAAVAAFLARPSFEVQRLTSKGTRTVDARAAVMSLVATDPVGACATLRMFVRQMTPGVRPDDILAALSQLSALRPTSPPLVTRLWQGPASPLTAGKTGAERPAQTGTTAARDETGSVTREAARRMPEPAPYDQGATARHQEHLPRSTTDKAMQREAPSAVMAPASQLRANQQLPRGTLDQLADPRAREPYGRDRPDARDRATEWTVRVQ